MIFTLRSNLERLCSACVLFIIMMHAYRTRMGEKRASSFFSTFCLNLCCCFLWVNHKMIQSLRVLLCCSSCCCIPAAPLALSCLMMRLLSQISLMIRSESKRLHWTSRWTFWLISLVCLLISCTATTSDLTHWHGYWDAVKNIIASHSLCQSHLCCCCCCLGSV